MGDDLKENIIRIFHVHKRYGAKYALKDIDFSVKKNEFVYITGPSGAGKSTLLKLLYFGEPVSEGQILVDGMNFARISSKQIPYLRRKIGIVFQDFKLIPSMTVFDNIALVMLASGMNTRFIQKRVKVLLRTVGMENKSNSYPMTLSGGEQQRVAVARSVAANPKIILADEPTGSLDSDAAEVVLDLLYKFHLRGATIIVATHDKNIIRDKNRRNIRLDHGTMIRLS